MPYKVLFTKEAFKDFKKLSPKLQSKLRDIITKQIVEDPYSGKKLIGDLSGFYSIRLSYKDRMVYSFDETDEVVHIHRVKTHYGK